MGLKKNDVPVEMVWFPREPHGLREPQHQLDKMKREYAFFSEYVLGEAVPDTRTEREKVIEVVQNVFTYLAAGDSENVKTLFWPGATLVSDQPDEAGERRQTFTTVEDWVGSATRGSEEMAEPEVSINDNIASVWARYSSGASAATGVDAFHLVKTDGEWKIMSFVYTQSPME